MRCFQSSQTIFSLLLLSLSSYHSISVSRLHPRGLGGLGKAAEIVSDGRTANLGHNAIPIADARPSFSYQPETPSGSGLLTPTHDDHGSSLPNFKPDPTHQPKELPSFNPDPTHQPRKSPGFNSDPTHQPEPPKFKAEPSQQPKEPPNPTKKATTLQDLFDADPFTPKKPTVKERYVSVLKSLRSKSEKTKQNIILWLDEVKARIAAVVNKIRDRTRVVGDRARVAGDRARVAVGDGARLVGDRARVINDRAQIVWLRILEKLKLAKSRLKKFTFQSRSRPVPPAEHPVPPAEHPVPPAEHPVPPAERPVSTAIIPYKKIPNPDERRYYDKLLGGVPNTYNEAIVEIGAALAGKYAVKFEDDSVQLGTANLARYILNKPPKPEGDPVHVAPLKPEEPPKSEGDPVHVAPPKLVFPKISPVARLEQYFSLIQAQTMESYSVGKIASSTKLIQALREQLTAAEEKTLTSLKGYVSRLDQGEFDKSFAAEKKRALASIKTPEKLDKELDLYFPKVFLDEEDEAAKLQKDSAALENDLNKPAQIPFPMREFAKARTAQLAESSPQTLVRTSILTPSDIVRTLDKDLDLNAELFRYSMLKGFENIIDEVKGPVIKKIAEGIQGKIDSGLRLKSQSALTSFFKGSTSKEDVEQSTLNSLFKSTSKEDVEWREKLFINVDRRLRLSPSEMFKKLKEQPTKQDRIRFAVTQKAGSLPFLTEEQLYYLRGSPNPGVFKGRINTLIKDLGKNNDEIKTLEQLRQDVIQSFSNTVNHPFAQELFDRGFINEATRDKLIPTTPITQAEFESKLGTEAEFTQVLMTQFQNRLLNELHTRSKEDEARAAYNLAQQAGNQLTIAAQAVYLQPGAFTKANQYRFDKAIKSFNSKAATLGEKPIDSQQFTKAYFDSKYPQFSERNQVKVLLDELKLPPLTSSLHFEGAVGRKIAFYDERLHSLYVAPLVKGDQRLKGTTFENRPSEQGELNSLAQRIFGADFNNLVQHSESMRSRGEKIAAIAAGFTAEEKETMLKKFQDLLATRLQLNPTPSHLYNKEQLDKLEKLRAERRAREAEHKTAEQARIDAIGKPVPA